MVWGRRRDFLPGSQEVKWRDGNPPRNAAVPALAVETPENWLEQHRYLNMDDLREYKKEALRRAT